MNKNTLNPPLSPLPGGLFISSLFEGVLGGGGGGGGGGVKRDKGWGGLHVVNQERRMVSALPKGLEYKVEKLKCKKVGGHAPDGKNQILTSSR